MKNITSRRMLSSIAFGACLLTGLAAGTACSSADDGGPFALFRAILRANQEVNNPVSNAQGQGTVRVFTDRAQIDVAMTTNGLTNVTLAHIHFGDLGVNGPPIFTLFDGTGTFGSPLTRTLLPGDFVPVAGLATFADAENAIQSGRCYLNVHTAANGGGEIRGQIGPVALDANLDGVEEVPPVTTTALGTLTINGNGGEDTFTVGLNTTGLTNVTGAHIHVGETGSDGPVIFPLFSNAGGPFTGNLDVTLRAAQFTPQPAAGVDTFEDAVSAILGGHTYANVHTTANPDGEIRGQIVP